MKSIEFPAPVMEVMDSRHLNTLECDDDITYNAEINDKSGIYENDPVQIVPDPEEKPECNFALR